MRTLSKRLGVTFAILMTGIAGMMSLRAQTPVPPIKPGLWETRMSQLDANGKEVPSPEFAALARMPPERRAQMEQAMRARGVQFPDETGAIKSCITRETLETSTFEQLQSEAGCTTTFSTRSSSLWKWHSSCASTKSESDGEMTFTGTDSYRTKLVSTTSITGSPRTSTRIVTGKWLGAACGDVKPLTLPPAAGRGR